jgi:hypothetical protein
LAGRARVVDGDTVLVGGVHVRLKGVAAPEVPHPGHAGEPGGEAAKAFMVELVEGQAVVCDLTQERTHGRRVGYCYRDSQDIAAELISAGLARDCPRFSAGRYAAAEPAAARSCRFPRTVGQDKQCQALAWAQPKSQRATSAMPIHDAKDSENMIIAACRTGGWPSPCATPWTADAVAAGAVETRFGIILAFSLEQLGVHACLRHNPAAPDARADLLPSDSYSSPRSNLTVQP